MRSENLDKVHEGLMKFIEENKDSNPDEVGSMMITIATSLLLDMAPNLFEATRVINEAIIEGTGWSYENYSKKRKKTKGIK